MEHQEDFFKNCVEGRIDENNTFHPKQISKNNNVEFIKLAYKMLFDDIEWYKKNMAANYFELINKNKNGKKDRN